MNDGDFVLPDGWSVEDFKEEDLAPEGYPEHDCDGSIEHDFSTGTLFGDDF